MGQSHSLQEGQNSAAHTNRRRASYDGAITSSTPSTSTSNRPVRRMYGSFQGDRRVTATQNNTTEELLSTRANRRNSNESGRTSLLMRAVHLRGNHNNNSNNNNAQSSDDENNTNNGSTRNSVLRRFRSAGGLLRASIGGGRGSVGRVSSQSSLENITQENEESSTRNTDDNIIPNETSTTSITLLSNSDQQDGAVQVEDDEQPMPSLTPMGDPYENYSQPPPQYQAPVEVPASYNTVSFANPHYEHAVLYPRRESDESDNVSDMEDEDYNDHDFYPAPSRNYEWMGRSIESLLLGHTIRQAILQLQDPNNEASDDGDYDFYALRRRSTASTFGGLRRRSSAGSFPGGRRGSLSLSVASGGGSMQGGTLANYYNSRRRQTPADVDRTGRERRTSNDNRPAYRRGSMLANVPATINSASSEDRTTSTSSNSRPTGGAGPNVLLNIMARESTGKSCFPRGIPESQRLRTIGGGSLFAALDKPAAGMASEVAFLAAAIDTGDWAETHAIVSRLVVRLIGDPASEERRSSIDDPNLPPTAHKFYAGGGRLGLERDAFVQAGGVQVLIRMFREKGFVGQEMAMSYDARDLGEGIVATRLAPCWNEALASLRELVYFIPSLVEDGLISDDGDFLPFLFTLLSHDSCFDGAAALIEEMLSFMSQTQQQQQNSSAEGAEANADVLPPVRSSPASTFFLGNVPDLYKLWRGFSCRQLAHFCRILALLVFEPEDRQLLESPAVLKSLELLQLRRNRAARAGRDSTVDMNQSILLGDEVLMERLLKLLSVMNYAPPLRRFSPYHVMAHFPFIADTLVMLGLGELDSFDDIDRQDRLARKLLEEDNDFGDDDAEVALSELGSVADMLENLSETLAGNRQQNQIGHIIHVIAAAQQAGVIVGRSRNRRSRLHRRNHSAPDASNNETEEAPRPDIDVIGNVGEGEGSTIQGLASVAGILTDQLLVRRLYQNNTPGMNGEGMDGENNSNEPRHFINTPEDAANSLQFNAMLLGPYQVEVLFVLCTLLGGRRKLDAQDLLNKLNVVSVLDGMFQRLPWAKQHQSGNENGDDNERGDQNGDQPNGIHGPGCECTPESALCVQYLRMLHNFCDRDCDNYDGRRLLLSESQRDLIFGSAQSESKKTKPGLLTKIIHAFINESDESPYRFWLASCIESYLRGSSPVEQIFVAQSGLLDHLVDEISSDKLHCAGSLQTSFDLLGELGKGNAEVIRFLLNDLDEESFRKLMSVAAANLVDSNVFIRSLLLSLERLSAESGVLPLYYDMSNAPAYHWNSPRGDAARSYLSHSWWDAKAISLPTEDRAEASPEKSIDEERASDWFPPRDIVEMHSSEIPDISIIPSGLTESVGHYGWVFTPSGESLAARVFFPNTVERLSWFLAANQARLLRDLLGVVDLRNINHENICCLNTAVVIAIFAHRRKQLAHLLDELRKMNNEEKESKKRAQNNAAQEREQNGDVVDRAFAQAMRYSMDLNQRETPAYARRASLSNTSLSVGIGGTQQIGDRNDVMRNFREVLWFWREYYTHRGRDRLSLEFSSHIRFQEWNHVVSLLVADDGSSTSLVRSPVRLPRSPYQRAARQ